MSTLFAGVLAALVSTAFFSLLGWVLIPRFFDLYLLRLLSQNPKKSLLELFYSIRSTPVSKLFPIGFRAERGEVATHPMGSTVPPPNLEKIVFVPAQLERPPLNPSEVPRLDTVIGPRCRRPLRLAIPVLIAGMGWGIGLSKEAKIALAKASTLAGIAANTGEGPFLAEEREAARLLVVQYSRGAWSHDPRIWRQADMLEIQVGQGAEAGSPIRKPYAGIPADAARAMGLKPGQDLIIDGRLHFRGKAVNLPELVRMLRSETDGIPVGVKLAAGGRLERDLELAVLAGVDFIAVDGSEAGTADAPIVLADDFGIPTLQALIRAAAFFEREGLRGRVSLIVSGGLRGASDFAKCLAMGADAVAIGSAAVIAMVHRQIGKTLPALPPTALVFAKGERRRRFDAERGAQDLANFLKASRLELETILRAAGKTDIRSLNREDLRALDQETAALTGLRSAAEPLPDPASALLELIDRWLGELRPAR